MIEKPVYRRLDRDRFEGLPIRKNLRVIDDAAMNRARRRGRCEVCGVPLLIADPHHITTRAANGADSDSNLISLCRRCHTRAHTGEISKYELRQIVASRMSKSSLPLDPTAHIEAKSPHLEKS